MSRWFRHYAGMCRDEDLVLIAEKTGSSIERSVWVWHALLESAAEIDRDGVYSVHPDEMAYFLHADDIEIEDILFEFNQFGLTKDNCIRQFEKYSRWLRRLPWTDWAVIRLGIFQRDNYKCRYCGATGVPLECDHVIPVSRGGSNEKTNLVTACKACNGSKGSKSLEELGWAL